MIFWLMLILMFLAALAFVLVPLLRNRREIPDAAPQSLEVYKAQLRELDADRVAGLIGDAEAITARTEIERRLLRAAKPQEEAGGQAGRRDGVSRGLLVTGAAILLLLSAALYMTIGMPGMTDFALKSQQHSRERRADTNEQTPALRREVAELRQALAADPADAATWRRLGLIEGRLGDNVAAAQAFQHWYELEPDNIDAAVVYGESLIMLADGQVGPAALMLLHKARAAAPRHPAVRHYLAMAQYQAGDVEQALANWRQLEAESRPGVPWLPQVRAWIGRAENDLGIATAQRPAAAPALSAAERQAVADMSADEQRAMIEGMVQKLQDKMDANPENIEGWFRLAQAYRVLGRDAAAARALEQALEHAPEDQHPLIKKQLEILREEE